ncbi:MAG: Asp-tRNA(Asn)/Glu-tRNA(Gln) amidotransferase subunit GatB [Myxococcales bacterium]|nr:Asp-tRNA(Asn)/Glu-tRNA(Gln) amidotransferase subunit GatB [Myxococcota bacterium]MDW8283261.1 Asp-tRNA(Asn)/Glu-tRNA(Gln) amidotransferase subunit GatB [Myxococcales bacterium]
MSATGPFEAVIGLECHVQLQTRSKLFSAASTRFGGAPNSQTDPYTLGLPGTLPVLNEQAVEFALRLGLSTGCRIRRVCRFARKHYFYPDLPKGYQISQLDEPLCEGGHIEFFVGTERRRVRLLRIHLEEDAGKSVHAPTGTSLVDLNRAGVPLVEIVSAPELSSGQEASEYLRAIRRLVRALRISDGNMEEGSLRCDANVSVRRRGETALGTRTELKNINSFRFVQRAIDHEVARQIDLLSRGGQVVQETRGWDAERGTSYPQRGKEEAHDYRYLPEPDLPPLHIDESWLARVRATLPETPMARYDRYVELGLPHADAQLLSSEPELGEYFDRTLSAAGGARAARLAAAWIGSELLGALHRDGRDLPSSPVGPEALAELLRLILDGTLSGKLAKEVFARCYSSGERPAALVAREGLSQISDALAIEAVCRRVIEAHPQQAAKYRAGASKLLGFFIGQVMRETGGRANPERVRQVLESLLGEKS